jgi:long-chain acyl-CoA synthetase
VRRKCTKPHYFDEVLAKNGYFSYTIDHPWVLLIFSFVMQRGKHMPTINSLFAATVERFANRIAIIEPTAKDVISTLTYRELQARAQGFAGYLQNLQIGKDDNLLIWSPSRSDWLIAYLGALVIGAVVVPLDINSREDFLMRVAETTNARLLITSQKQYAALKKVSLPLVDIDALPQEPLDTTKLPAITEGDLAEIVFTSGTTGQPKGVMLSHGNIASNASTAVTFISMKAEDRALSILPLSHMFELTVEIALICCGASIVYARSLVPETLLKLLSTQHITCSVLVPQALQLFLNGIEREVRRQKKEKQFNQLLRVAARLPFGWRRLLFGTVHKRFGGHFRFFVSGGAYLPPRLAQRWENMGFRVLQGYGATECAPIICATPFNDHTLDSVGKPLNGVEVRIAEDGEILVHGPNVASGYWKNPDATAASFKDGWYYTGDLGYKDANNNLCLKGRKKNLIVLANGLNVYPEDIENVLQANTLIKDAAVFGLMENDQGPEVHAVLLMDEPSNAKTVIQQTNKQLASHQQIRGFTVWPETDFPRTHTLKVKRLDVFSQLEKLRSPS